MADRMKDLRVIARAFNLGNIHLVRDAPGDSSSNSFVVCDRGEVVVKIFYQGGSDDMRREEALYGEEVSLHNVPAPSYLRDVQGDTVFRDGGLGAMVLPRVDGVSATGTLHEVTEVAKALANIHEVPTMNLPSKPKKGWMTRSVYLQGAETLRVNFGNEPNAQALLAFHTKQEGWRKNVLPLLPRSIIHGDLHHHNVLFSGSTLNAVLDWEDSAIYASLADFCISASHFCWPNFIFDENLFREYAKAYQSVRPLRVKELPHVTACMHHIVAVQSVWRYLQHFHVNPDVSKEWEHTKLWKMGVPTWKAPSI